MSAQIFGEHMELIEYKDIYGLYWRVREIRPSYRLLLNRKTGFVELHDSNFGGKCMTFSLPLLPNIIDKINGTRIENATQIFRKIEQENMKNDIKNVQNAIDYTKYSLFNL